MAASLPLWILKRSSCRQRRRLPRLGPVSHQRRQTVQRCRHWLRHARRGHADLTSLLVTSLWRHSQVVLTPNRWRLLKGTPRRQHWSPITLLHPRPQNPLSVKSRLYHRQQTLGNNLRENLLIIFSKWYILAYFILFWPTAGPPNVAKLGVANSPTPPSRRAWV